MIEQIDYPLNNWDSFPNLKSTTPFCIKKFQNYCDYKSYILDVGCGYGRVCAELEKNDFSNIYGIDKSWTQIKRAFGTLKKTKIVFGDAIDLPFPSDRFGMLITFGLINCLLHDNELNLLIKECNRVLAKNGVWFINMYAENQTPYFKKKYDKFSNRFGHEKIFKSNSGLLFRHHSLDDFLSKLKGNFKPLEVEEKKFLSFNQTKEVNGYSIVLEKI